jgi:4-amino-4-deoxychorismate mutase
MSEPLQVLRARLDAIDARLLEAIRERLACCVEIGRYKARTGTAMMQPARIGVVKARATAFGREHGIDEQFLSNLYDVIIAETCRLEVQVIDGVSREARAREDL